MCARRPRAFEAFLHCVALCNLVSVFREQPCVDGEADEAHAPHHNAWAATGDPTEISIQVFAHRYSHGRPKLLQKGHKQLAEYSFPSDLKRMAVTFAVPRGMCTAYMKGAVECVLNVCGTIRGVDGDITLSTDAREDIMRSVDAMAS